MAAPDIVKGSYIDILVGDGATPEVFSVLCGFSTNSFTEQVNTSDEFTYDCADPEDVPFRVLNVTGRQWTIGGEGLHNRAQGALLRTLIGQKKSYRFRMSEPTADNIDDGYYYGVGVIVNRAIGGSRGAYATSSLTIESDGEWLWADAA